jgi:hypothetical protein
VVGALTIADAWTLISQGGTTGMLFLGIVGFLREWWVTGRAHRRLQQECDDWKGMALSGTSLAGRAVRLADKTAVVRREDGGS